MENFGLRDSIVHRGGMCVGPRDSCVLYTEGGIFGLRSSCELCTEGGSLLVWELVLYCTQGEVFWSEKWLCIVHRGGSFSGLRSGVCVCGCVLFGCYCEGFVCAL